MKTITSFLLLLLSATVNGQFILTDYFHPVGPSESLIAPFNHSSEATTAVGYKGLIGVNISNFGWDNQDEAYDGFYYFINSQGIPRISGKGLSIAFDGNTFITGPSYYIADGGQSPNSPYQIVFNETVGHWDGLNLFGIPAYNPDHIYNFVLDINSPTERIINFGFNDAGLSDNFGQWDITIIPVAVGAVPEPSSVLLLIIISGYTIGTVRKRN